MAMEAGPVTLKRLFRESTSPVKRVEDVVIYQTVGVDYFDPTRECCRVWAKIDGETVWAEEWIDVLLDRYPSETQYKFYVGMIAVIEQKVKDALRTNAEARLGFGFVK